MQQFLPAPVALLLLGAGLLIWHVKAWRIERSREHDSLERVFYRRQFRRRAIASVLLVICAGLMAGGMLIPHKQFPASFAACWMAAILTLPALVVTALFDMAANRGRIVRLQREQLVNRAILKAQMGRQNGQQE